MIKVLRYIVAAVMLLICSSAFAQNVFQAPGPNQEASGQDFKHHGTGTDWGARMRSEKIGFLTAEINLTPQEAQKFWPIYNKAEEEKGAAMHMVISSYGDLQKALYEGKGNFSKLLDAYLKANARQSEIDVKYAKEYEKVLSEEKVAKLYVAEEKFRREQINKLNPATRGGWFGPQQGR